MQIGSDIPDSPEAMQGGKTRLAVVDFDGTLLAGKSPVILIRYLLKGRQMGVLNTFAITMWGLAYKLHLPVSEAWVRGRVFRAFSGKPQAEVDAFLKEFYDIKIAHRLRQSVLAELDERRAEGCVLVTVSATFEPIVERMAEQGVVDYAIATRMCVDAEGNYTSRCDGHPVEGDQKLVVLREWADALYGKGAWELEWAYSDHYSDKPLLNAAAHSVAVDPDTTLRKAANKNGWRIIES